MALEYRMLGPLELRVAAGALPLGGRRQQTLLAVLLLNAGATVEFDRLIADLWERPPTTARRQVVNAAAVVRRTVEQAGGGPLITVSHGYRLEVGRDWLDVDVFGALRREADAAAAGGHRADAVRLLHGALDQWRGPVLAGLGGETVELARRSLAEQRLSAVERLAALRLELGEVSSVVGWLIGLVAEHPARESLRATLMRALDLAGRPADALAVFEEGRRYLAEEFGADPGPELRGLHERILRSDQAPGVPAPGEASRDRTATPTGPAGTPGPCYLPSGIPDFTGRRADLSRLATLSAGGATGASAVVTVEGMGGVGKTALAVHLAHQLAGAFPDGQHFVDLRGFTEDEPPMRPDAALEVLLRQIGVAPDQVPAGTTARQDLWRARMAGRRALILLDNAADAAQLRPLLPASPGSLVLVTSRRQLMALDGAVPLALDVLDADEATGLFRRIAGPHRVDAEAAATREVGAREVIALCGGLPLAIRIAAARFRRRPAWTLDDLAEQLRGERGLTAGDRSVAGVIELSDRHLSPPGRRLFHLLGLVPGPDFDNHAAASVAGLEVAAAGTGLEELLECNLVLQDTRGRYRLHDLVRDCARVLAARTHPEDELRAARHRLFDYYLHFADVHGRQVSLRGPVLRPDLRHPPPPVPPAPSQRESIQRFEVEYDNLVAAASYAGGHGWHRHAWQLPCLMLPFLNRVGARAGMLELARNAVAATRELGDRRGESLALATVAAGLRGQGRPAEMHAALELSVRISREVGDPAAIAARVHDLGNVLFQAGRLAEAAASFAEARDLARDLGDRAAEVSDTFNLAVVDCNLGRYENALEHFNRALAHHRQDGNAEGEYAALINIGWVSQLQDRDGDAVAALDRAVRLSRAIGAVDRESRALAWLAVSYRRLGQVLKAIEVGRAAVDAARRTELPEHECDALNGLGEACLAARRWAEAETAFRAAERLAGAGALPMEGSRAIEGLAHLAAAHGALDRARQLWERALAGYQPGAVEAENPQAHLLAPDGAAARCMRCQTTPVSGQ